MTPAAPMTPAEQAVAAHFHFEAEKAAYRQVSTRDGDRVAITLYLDPQDVPSALAIAPLHTRYVVAMVEKGDDERPVMRAPEPPKTAVRGALLETEAADHVRRPALSLVGKEHYANADQMERARIDSVMRCKDPRFWTWADQPDSPVRSEEEAKRFIYRECRISSRAEIGKNERAYRAFLALDTQYMADTNQIAEER